MMVSWSPAWLALPFMAAMHLSVATAHGQEDPARELTEFRKKIATKEAERSSQNAGENRIAGQLRAIEGMLAREDFDKAQQALGNGAYLGLNAELQEEWQDLADRLGRTIETRRTQALEKWRLEVDQLLVDARKGCLEAKNSAEIDPLLVRCAAAQMRRDTRGNILTERTNKKLAAIVTTLNAWATYLDCRDTGKITQANTALRSAFATEYPVLSTTEINSRILLDARNAAQWRTFIANLVKEVASPDDLPAIIQRLKKEIATDVEGTETQMAAQDQSRIETLYSAWAAAKAGNLAGANRALLSYKGYSTTDALQRSLEPLVPIIVNYLLQSQAKSWTQLTPSQGEDATGYLTRVLEELKAAGNFSTMIEVLKFAEQLYRNQQSILTVTADRTALDNFLSAQRFEQAGDMLAAVVYYRLVIGATGAKFAPTEEAGAALKKLARDHPEAVKSYEGSMAEDIRVMRQNIQMLLNRPPSSMGRPYPGF